MFPNPVVDGDILLLDPVGLREEPVCEPLSPRPGRQGIAGGLQETMGGPGEVDSGRPCSLEGLGGPLQVEQKILGRSV